MIAPPEERALVTLIAEAERTGRTEEALRLAEEKQAMARRRLGVSGRGFTSSDHSGYTSVRRSRATPNRPPRSPVTDHATVDLSIALERFLALPDEERQALLAAGAHFRGERVVAKRLPVSEIAKLTTAIREAQR